MNSLACFKAVDGGGSVYVCCLFIFIRGIVLFNAVYNMNNVVHSNISDTIILLYTTPVAFFFKHLVFLPSVFIFTLVILHSVI